MLNHKLNWLSDDGINLSMINDIPRNTFYDKILSHNVKNKKCCDIGFGTGLLSLLALKHGAESVIAYEKDPARFELGQWVIKNLGLSNVIDLRNDLANSQHIVDDQCQVVFHEIIHQGLWGEGVWWIRPETSGITYLPGSLFFELHAVEISDSAVSGMLNGASEVDYFNPGVDIDTEFVNLINQVILGESKEITAGDFKDHLVKTSWNSINKYWNCSPLKVFEQHHRQLLAGYTVDYNSCTTTFYDSHGTRTTDLTDPSCQLLIDTTAWKSKNMLLELRFGLRHEHECLYLDACRGWGEDSPWLFVKPQSDLIFTQNFSKPAFQLKKS
jgi:hypothetical protein